MPKTAPKPQLTAVTALNPWCCVLTRTGRRKGLRIEIPTPQDGLF